MEGRARKDGLKKNALQFAHFSLIGLFNGALDLILLNAMLAIWHTKNPYGLILINSIAYSAAVLNSYYWNAKLTFRKESEFSAKEKTAFAAQGLFSLLVSNGVFVLFVYWLSFTSLPLWVVHNGSKGLSMGSSSLCSYFLMKTFVFKGNKAKRSP